MFPRFHTNHWNICFSASDVECARKREVFWETMHWFIVCAGIRWSVHFALLHLVWSGLVPRSPWYETEYDVSVEQTCHWKIRAWPQASYKKLGKRPSPVFVVQSNVAYNHACIIIKQTVVHRIPVPNLWNQENQVSSSFLPLRSMGSKDSES